MVDTAHTPTPWKVVSDPNFENGYIYTSIQPETTDEGTMRHLLMANGEYHVCRMTHTAAMHKVEAHRANAAHIVKCVNEAEAKDKRIAELEAALHFYADARKYPAPLTGGMGALWIDCGETARTAIAKAGEA